MSTSSSPGPSIGPHEDGDAQRCSTESLTAYLLLVDSLAARLRAAKLDPRRDQEWWATASSEARSERLREHVSTCGVEALSEALDPASTPDQHRTLLLFYLAWTVAHYTERRQDAEVLVDLIRAQSGVSRIADYGGDDLLSAFDALLLLERSRYNQLGLLQAYDLADRTAKRLSSVLAFRRTRRSIGLELLELPAFGSHPRFDEISSSVAADFSAEREVRGRETPQLVAEAITFEARYEAVARPPTWKPNYRRAIELVSQAMAIDRPTRRDDTAYQLRLLEYGQRLNVLSALDVLATSSGAMEDRLIARQDKALESVRSETIQLVGLLAGVVGLVTSLFASAKADGGELIVAALASSAAIVGFLVAFNILSGRLADRLRILGAILTFALLLGAAVVVWRM